MQKSVVRLATFALVLLPTLAMADCYGTELEQTANTCLLPGMTWDDEKGTCVPTPSS